MSRTAIILLVVVLVFASVTAAGDRARQTELFNPTMSALDVEDFATYVLNGNRVGQFVCNQGRFYPGSGEVGVTAEWPAGSGHEQMYRMNVFVGIPNNVVQSRTSRTREWNPLPGYHNGEVGLLAVSTDNSTWPRDELGEPYWPVQDGEGNARILSMQDSYGVYDDGNNALGEQDPANFLNIEIHQSSYSWNTAVDDDYIVFQFDVINKGDPKDSLYFTHYSDLDCGGWRGLIEYADDILVFDQDQRAYFQYDADNQTDNWEGDPFPIAIVFLSTPEVDGEEVGITDWHYTSDAREPDGATEDTEFFWYMSSDPRLRDNETDWPDLFHGDDIHFDDPSLIPPEGREITVFSSSGPYHMEQGDTLRFIIAMVCGEDQDDVEANVDRIWQVYNDNWTVKFVPQPIVTGLGSDSQVTLTWDNSLDVSYVDIFTGTNTLAGYRIYKTEDPRRLTWSLLDSLLVGEYAGSEGEAQQYQWSDDNVTNGFYYSYAVTAFDSTGDASGIAALSDSLNTVEVRPASAPNTTNLQRIRVVPNPFVVSAAWERERLGNLPEGEPVRELAFVNLPPECTIKIFTVDGDLVRTIDHDNGTGTEYWDIRSDYNQMVSTGVYFYHVDSSHGEHLDKFAIVR
jgi:hypothetical protein